LQIESFITHFVSLFTHISAIFAEIFFSDLAYSFDMAIKSYFTEHPESTGESYAEHFMVAISVSRQLLGAGLAAAAHALLPNFHKTTASERIHSLAHCLETGNRDAITPLRKVPCREALRQAS
jgi:hypothetical protein